MNAVSVSPRAWPPRWAPRVRAIAAELGARAPGLALLACALARAPSAQTLEGPDPAVVRVNGRARIALRLEHGAASAECLAPLAPEGLLLELGAPQTIALGGEPSRFRTSWSAELVAQRAGRFEIAPFALRAGGSELRTRACSLVCVERLEPADFAFVEIASPRSRAWEREPLPLALRFGFDSEFLRANLVQLFAAPLDVPVQISAAWLDALPGALRVASLEPALPAGARVRVALGERVVEAERVADEQRHGRDFAVFELRRVLAIEHAGLVALPAPRLRFAWASEFASDALSGRVPLDRELLELGGASRVWTIDALPEQGRPADFAGAVGEFRIEARWLETEAASVDTLELELSISGAGAAELVDAPRLDALTGFDVLGALPEQRAGARVVRYTLRPRDASAERVPPIEFTYFDPREPAGYRRVQTPPLALRARAQPAAQPAAQPSDEARSSAPAAPLARPAVLAGLAALLALVVAAVFALRRRSR